MNKDVLKSYSYKSGFHTIIKDRESNKQEKNDIKIVREEVPSNLVFTKKIDKKSQSKLNSKILENSFTNKIVNFICEKDTLPDCKQDCPDIPYCDGRCNYRTLI